MGGADEAMLERMLRRQQDSYAPGAAHDGRADLEQLDADANAAYRRLQCQAAPPHLVIGQIFPTAAQSIESLRQQTGIKFALAIRRPMRPNSTTLPVHFGIGSVPLEYCVRTLFYMGLIRGRLCFW